MRTKKEIALLERWVKALRSGKYKQTKNELRRIDEEGTSSYCCLGVLCDLNAKKKHANWVDDNSFLFNYVESSGLLSDDMLRMANISYRFQQLLSNMNDDGKKSFKVIADRIEKEIKQEKYLNVTH